MFVIAFDLVGLSIGHGQYISTSAVHGPTWCQRCRSFKTSKFQQSARGMTWLIIDRMTLDASKSRAVSSVIFSRISSPADPATARSSNASSVFGETRKTSLIRKRFVFYGRGPCMRSGQGMRSFEEAEMLAGLMFPLNSRDKADVLLYISSFDSTCI